MDHLPDPTNRRLFEELLEVQRELRRRIEETLSNPKKVSNQMRTLKHFESRLNNRQS
jgi:hypothetical protein